MLSTYILLALFWMGATRARSTKLARPPAFFLAGDSTTAPNGGWGDAFVASLTNDATGINFGDSGATTSSFRAEGYWADLLAAVESHRKEYEPYVTIQFGHNDQKTESGLAAFVDNLVQFDADVRAAGGVPIFLTSLTRRSFNGDGTVVRNLENVREMTIQAAERTGALWADLNLYSREYVEAIGQEKADTYNLSEGDRTHVNKAGGVVFAGLVGLLLEDLKPELSSYISIDEELVTALEQGVYYYP